jgi:WD40 repeat protein
LASASDDGTIKLWPKDGKGNPMVLSNGNHAILELATLTDGRLASSDDDDMIKLWPTDGKGESTVLSHEEGVPSLAVLTDGRLASATEAGIKLWIVDEQKLIAALCLRVGRNLSKDEWARYVGSDTPWQPSCRGLPSNWRTPA